MNCPQSSSNSTEKLFERNMFEDALDDDTCICLLIVSLLLNGQSLSEFLQAPPAASPPVYSNQWKSETASGAEGKVARQPVFFKSYGYNERCKEFKTRVKLLEKTLQLQWRVQVTSLQPMHLYLRAMMELCEAEMRCFDFCVSDSIDFLSTCFVLKCFWRPLWLELKKIL